MNCDFFSPQQLVGESGNLHLRIFWTAPCPEQLHAKKTTQFWMFVLQLKETNLGETT